MGIDFTANVVRFSAQVGGINVKGCPACWECHLCFLLFQYYPVTAMNDALVLIWVPAGLKDNILCLFSMMK